MSETSIPVPENSTIAHCHSEWERVYKAKLAKKEPEFFAIRDAGLAYRIAMPSLAEQEHIRDFIGCVAHGILIGAIEGKSASQLLYAAQVALSMNRREPPSCKDKAA
jgi:hypothetical protein